MAIRLNCGAIAWPRVSDINNNMLRKQSITLISGMLSFSLNIASMMIAIENETSKGAVIARLIFITLAAFFFVICNMTVTGDRNIIRILWVDIAVILYHLVLDAATMRLLIGIKYKVQILNELLWLIVAVYCIVWMYKRRKECVNGAMNEIVANSRFVLIAMIFSFVLIALSYDVDGPHFVWDGFMTYNEVIGFRSNGIPAYNMRSAFGFNHTSFAYFHPIIVFRYLLESVKWAFFVNNALLIMAASFGTVFLIKSILAGKSIFLHIISSSVILFSPFICGMSTYYSCDFGIVCMAPAVILFAYKRDWIWLFLSGFAVSMMKEPGLVFFGAVCFAVMLCDYMKKTSDIREIMFHKRTATWLLIAVLFGLLYSRYAGWGG